jgi:hypothetical protein
VTPGVERLARGIVASLFAEDVEHVAAALPREAKLELLGDEWPAVGAAGESVPSGRGR